MQRMPNTRVQPDGTAIAGGMDIVGSPIYAKPGRARIAYNYEWSTGGGLERIAGIEPFDGRPSPSAAVYVYLECSATIAGISLGDTVDGATSGASGKVVYLSGAYIGLTRVTGSFELEDLEVSAVVKATLSNLSPAVDGFLDNTLAKLAADDYQADITKVPGSGRVRGIAILTARSTPGGTTRAQRPWRSTRPPAAGGTRWRCSTRSASRAAAPSTRKPTR